MNKKTKQEAGEMMIRHASRLAQEIAKYIHANKEIQKYGMTTVAYAVEMLLSTPFLDNMRTYDKESTEFRKFMAIVHDDVKNLINTADMMAN